MPRHLESLCETNQIHQREAKMADLNKELQDYLSRSEKGPGGSGQAGGSAGQSQRLLSLPALAAITPKSTGKWFGGKGGDKVSSAENGGQPDRNGWFGGYGAKTTQPDDAATSCFPALSHRQRIVGFVACIGMGIFCFGMAALYTPMLVFKARKFALMYTLGSLFIIFSFSFLWGPWNHLRHLFSSERAAFTATYFGTLFATLYCALSLQSTPLTVLFAVGQVIALLWFLSSYLPGGQTGIRFFGRVFSSSVSKTLPV